MQRRHILFSILALAVTFALVACGGNSPTSPSGNGVTLHGVALGSGAGSTFHGRAGALSTSGGSITVTVAGTTISTTISANGTFELEGLPAGTFTLTFSSNGVTIGTVTITSVPTDAEVNVVVQVNTTVVILVKVEVNGTDETDSNDAKTCLIEGGKVGRGIELEGSVSSVSGTSFVMTVNGERASGTVTVDASGASFKCNGDNGKEDNGKGGDNSGTCDATRLTGGEKIHVSGTLTSCSMTDAQVTASQVMLQH